METIKDYISSEGQQFVDEPVYVNPRSELINQIARSVCAAFKSKTPNRIQIGHERVQLQWMKLGPDGELIPK